MKIFLFQNIALLMKNSFSELLINRMLPEIDELFPDGKYFFFFKFFVVDRILSGFSDIALLRNHPYISSQLQSITLSYVRAG